MSLDIPKAVIIAGAVGGTVSALKNITLPGTNIDAATKAAALVKARLEAAVPKFDDLMSAAKNSLNTSASALLNPGSIAGPKLFADVSSKLNSLGTDASAVAAKIAEAQKNSAIDLAVSKAALAQKIREATARGETVSQDAINSALGPTKVLQAMQGALSNPAGALANLTQAQSDALAAKTDAINALKANTMLAMMSKPMAAGLASTVSSNVDPSVINNLTKFNVIKAQETSVTQTVAGQAAVPDPIRPSGSNASSTSIDAKPAQPVTPPSIDRMVFTTEVAAYDDKKTNALSAYLKYIGLTWSKGQPIPDDATRQASLLKTISGIYDGLVGRDGAWADREPSLAISKAKPNAADRTEEEAALIAKVKADREKFLVSDWWLKKQSLYKIYGDYFENYKLVYNCWINNGDRFTLPASVEKELKSG